MDCKHEHTDRNDRSVWCLDCRREWSVCDLVDLIVKDTQLAAAQKEIEGLRACLEEREYRRDVFNGNVSTRSAKKIATLEKKLGIAREAVCSLLVPMSVIEDMVGDDRRRYTLSGSDVSTILFAITKGRQALIAIDAVGTGGGSDV